MSKLREVVVYAAERGVRIAIEPINRYEADFIHSTADGLRMIADLGYDNLGLMLDVYHMNIEDPSIEASLAAAGDRLWHVHIADSNRRYPGSGHLPFDSIFATLRRWGTKAMSRPRSCRSPTPTRPPNAPSRFSGSSWLRRSKQKGGERKSHCRDQTVRIVHVSHFSKRREHP